MKKRAKKSKWSRKKEKTGRRKLLEYGCILTVADPQSQNESTDVDGGADTSWFFKFCFTLCFYYFWSNAIKKDEIQNCSFVLWTGQCFWDLLTRASLKSWLKPILSRWSPNLRPQWSVLKQQQLRATSWTLNFPSSTKMNSLGSMWQKGHLWWVVFSVK